MSESDDSMHHHYDTHEQMINEKNQWEKEKSLLTQFDLHLLPITSLLYLFCILSRVNIGNSRIYGFINGKGNMERDLGMDGNEFNFAVSIFYFSYVSFEVLSNIMLQKTGPVSWISKLALAWGLVACSMSIVQNYIELLVCRFLLGVFQAGYVPGVLLYYSLWYKKNEMGLRTGLFMSIAQFSTAFSGLLAFAISSIPGWTPWRWLFLIEGLPSLILGGLAFFLLPSTPQHASFLTMSQKDLAELRLESDGTSSNHSLNWKKISEALRDPIIWCFMSLLFGVITPAASLSVFLATLIRSWGYEDLDSQLFSTPPSLVAAFLIVLVGYSSDRYKDRFGHILFCTVMACISLIVLCFTENILLSYFMVSLALIGTCCSIPLCLSWVSNYCLDASQRSVAVALCVSFGNIGAALSGFIYRSSDAPFYKPGHFLLVLSCSGSILFTIVVWFLTRRKQNYEPVASLEIESS